MGRERRPERRDVAGRRSPDGLTQDGWKKGRDRRKGVGMRIFIETAQDVDGIAARAKKAGIALDAEPHDTAWGSRAFEATEPSGFVLTISSQT